MIRRPPRSTLFPYTTSSDLFTQGDPDYLTLLADRIYKAYFNDGPLTPARTAARLKVRCEELEKRSEEHTSELQSQSNLVCRLLLEKKKKQQSESQIIIEI